MNPWVDLAAERPRFAMLRWQWQRFRNGVPPAPDPEQLPRARPAVAFPAASVGEARVTWLGQSGFLLQIGGVNVLTDPMLSHRASPFARVGPARLVPAPLAVSDLPPIHGIVLSHDHYDHLDAPTCALLLERFGRDLPIFTPLAYRDWFVRLGARNVMEHDWWEAGRLPDTDLELVCLPAHHWTRRGFAIGTRLWSSWLIRAPHVSVFFCGDSGYCPAFREVRDRAGAPDIAILPIGAYEPRWLMKPMHMNPEEAVQAFLELGARDFVAMHWGTFRLTDEPMLEPPVRTRTAWRAHGLPETRLHIPRHGETLVWPNDARTGGDAAS